MRIEVCPEEEAALHIPTEVLLRLAAALTAFLLVCEQIKYAFSSGPLHMLFLPCLRYSHPSLHSSLCSNVT